MSPPAHASVGSGALPRILRSREAPPGWAALVTESTTSTFFHDRRWIELYARHHGGVPIYFHAEADGRLVGGLAAVRFTRGGLHFYESLPLGTYGGPITPESDVGRRMVAPLLEALRRLGRNPLCVRIQCSMRTPVAGAPPGFFSAVPLHLIPLPDTFDDFWYGVFPLNRRNECNRAMKRGVTVDTDVTHEDIESYYPIDVAAHARWQRRPHPEAFFHDVLDAGFERLRVFVVRAEGRVLGLHVCMISSNEILAWHGVTSREGSKRYFPTSMLARAEAEAGIEMGLRAINMGASGDLAGIARYKKLLGGEVIETSRFERNHPLVPFVRRLRRR